MFATLSVGVYGVVTVSQSGNKPRLAAKGIEYLGQIQIEEEFHPSPVRGEYQEVGAAIKEERLWEDIDDLVTYL